MSVVRTVRHKGGFPSVVRVPPRGQGPGDAVGPQPRLATSAACKLLLLTAQLYTGAHLSGAFAGLIAAGVQRGLAGAKGLESWRWLFIIEGSITVFAGLVAAFILPDYPAT